MAPATSSAAAANAKPPPSPPPPPPPAAAPEAPRGKFLALSFAPKSGKVDRVGSKDGVFTPDGVSDLVFEAEIEGAAIAFILTTADADGRANGTFTADTFVGTQLPPSEAGAEVKPGLGTAGIGIYEGEKLANAPDGSLMPLAEGPHKLTLYVSSAAAPKKGSYRAYAVFDDRSLVPSPIVSTK